MRDQELADRRRLSARLLLVAVSSAVVIATAAGIAGVPDDEPTLTALPGRTDEVSGAAEDPRAPGPSPLSGATDPDREALPPTTMSTSVPLRLRIPTIGVTTTLVPLGLESDGRLEVPRGAFPAGWFTGAPTPGELGPAVIAGHFDWAGRPGVFAELHRLTAGDVVQIDRSDGSTAYFRITSVRRVAKQDFPTADVYGDLDHAGLRLITCGGDFDRSRRSYVDNVIVNAEFVGASVLAAAMAS